MQLKQIEIDHFEIKFLEKISVVKSFNKFQIFIFLIYKKTLYIFLPFQYMNTTLKYRI